MKRLHRVASVCVLLLATLALVAPATPVASAPVRKILYVSRGDIFSVRPDGTQNARLTWTANNGQPTWSPTGSRFAFVSRRDGDMEIFTMNADGSGRRKLTSNRQIDTQPAWSPDGSKLAWVRDFTFIGPGGEETGAEIWVMNADGTGKHRFHLGTGGAFDGFMEEQWDPVWSPNGAYLAVQGIENFATQDYALWVREVATGDATLVVSGHYTTPAWASDGRAIACTYDGLYSYPPDGASARTLLVPGDTTTCQYPSMSSGRRFVAYVVGGVLRGRELGGHPDVPLAILLPHGGIGSRWAMRHPYDWSPDGRLMVAATPDGLRVVAPDNSYTRLLPVTGTDPSW